MTFYHISVISTSNPACTSLAHVLLDKCTLVMERAWTAGSICRRLLALGGIKELPSPGVECDQASSSSTLVSLAHLMQYHFLPRHGGSGKRTSSPSKPLPWPPCRSSTTGSIHTLPSPMKTGMTLRPWWVNSSANSHVMRSPAVRMGQRKMYCIWKGYFNSSSLRWTCAVLLGVW